MDEERVYLGFDASCTKCSGLAHSIEHAVEDRITVVPLDSPMMQRWRREALGEDAPWVPTLVRVRGETAEAWVGWRIARVLTQHLGARRTWRVLDILGADALDGKRGKPRSSRRTVLRAGLGAVAGMGLLAGAAQPAVAGGRREAADSTVAADAVTVLDGEQLMDAAMAQLQGEDAANVLDVASLGPVAAGAASLSTLSRSALRVAGDDTGEVSAGGALEVAGREVRYPDGRLETMIFIHHFEQNMVLISTTTRELVDRGQETYQIDTEVHRLHVDREAPDGPVLRTVSRSVNGGVPALLPETDLGTLSQNPCGGCCTCCFPQQGRLRNDCNWEWSVDCVLSAGGCALCGASCGAWWSCLLCIANNCVGALVACCSSYTAVCTHCQRCQT